MNPQTNALTIPLTYKLINSKPYKLTNISKRTTIQLKKLAYK